jgi:hypothetical protein
MRRLEAAGSAKTFNVIEYDVRGAIRGSRPTQEVQSQAEHIAVKRKRTLQLTLTLPLTKL